MIKLRALFVAVLAAVSLDAAAQNWPQKPVRFILSLGAGSGADIGARLYADRFTRMWGQPAVVENRPGGDGDCHQCRDRQERPYIEAPPGGCVAHPYTLDRIMPEELVPVARFRTVVTLAAGEHECGLMGTFRPPQQSGR
jgi:hypothetical protein